MKKHGYEVEESEDDIGNPCWDWWNVKNDCVEIYDNPHEQPILLVACLDEINRLGWGWGFSGYSSEGADYYLSCDRTVKNRLVQVPRMVGKTKTEACRNALLAVLEARAIFDKSGAER